MHVQICKWRKLEHYLWGTAYIYCVFFSEYANFTHRDPWQRLSISWVLDKSLFLLYCCAFLKVGNVEEDRACFVLVMHKLPFCVNCRDLQTPCRIFKARFCHSTLHEQMKGIDKESFMRVHWLIMFCQKFREPWLSTCFALVMFLELKIK